ncbi:hypothetical protein FRC00_000491, partial [Tulasnella sp. 408]
MGKANRAAKKKAAKAPPQIKKPSGVQSNQKPTEEEEEGNAESGVEDAGDADVNDAGAGEANGQGAGETAGGDGPKVGEETKDGDGMKEGGETREGGEETQTTDAHHQIPTGGGETKEGGETRASGQETQSIDAHHEILTGDQTSGPPGEGGSGETVADGSNDAEPKAAVHEGKGNEESEANDNGVDVGDKDELPKPNDAGAVEVAGLAELIGVIQAMGAGATEQPGVVAGLVDRLKNTPLYPAYEALQESWKKMLARELEMKAKQAALPPSPPLTPQTLSTISNKGPQHQHQLPSHPPSREFKDQETETDPPPPTDSTQASSLPPQTGSTNSTQDLKRRLKRLTQPPSRVFKDQEAETDPLPLESSTPPTQAPPGTSKTVPTNSTQDLRSRLKRLTQPPSKVFKDQQIGTDPLPPA